MNSVINKLKECKDILYIYWFPRRLYGIEPNKDFYWFVVTNDFKKPDDFSELVDSNYGISTIDNWFKKVIHGDILAWECACLNKKYVIKEHVKLLMKTDLLQLRNCVEEALSRANEPGNISSKSWFLKVIKYCIFANQIIENHKIVNYNVLGPAHNALSRANDDNLKEIFYNYFGPEYNLLKKRTDEILYKSKINKITQNE